MNMLQAMRDDAAEVIWDFSDRYYLQSTNPITQAILELAEEGRTIPDMAKLNRLMKTLKQHSILKFLIH